MSTSSQKSSWQLQDLDEPRDSILLDNFDRDIRPDRESSPFIGTSHHAHSSESSSSPGGRRPDHVGAIEDGEAESSVSHTNTETRKDKWRQAIRDWWIEIFWLVFSATSLAIIAISLLLLDGRPISDWQLSISLNAVVSAVIVAAKAALIYTTACCIGQLKWHHFQQQHPQSLYDLKTFDEASKGPLGALKLVIRLRSVSAVALFGALVVVAAVFMETFGQQILAYPSRSVEIDDSTAAFPVTQHLASQSTWYLDYTMMSDLQKLLLAAIFRGSASPMFECSSADCTWPASATLGICSSCRDITAASNGSCEGDSKSFECHYTTPQGVQIGGTVQPDGPMPLINTTTVDGVYDAMPSFYNFSTLVVAQSTKWKARLTECELSWCAWTYETATSKGTDLDLGPPRQFRLRFEGTWDKTNETLNLDDTQSVCTAVGGYPTGLNSTFTISQGKEYFLKYVLRLILKAGYQGADFYTQLTLATTSLDYTDTTAMSSNLAAFMTNALRTQDGTQSVGTAWQSVTFIQVRWLWLLLPTAVELAAVVLLALTIWQSTRHGTVLWKTSLLAFLFCSTHAWATSTATRENNIRSLQSMETASKKIKARLETDDQGGYRLIQI